MWKIWAYYFCFFNKSSCLRAIYLNNCNHLLPPPLPFPFGEKQLLEITSVSCEFWRRRQERNAKRQSGQSWPSQGTGWHKSLSPRGQSWCQQHLLEKSHEQESDWFPRQLLPRGSQPWPGWGCAFPQEVVCPSHAFRQGCPPLDMAPAAPKICAALRSLYCMVFSIARWHRTQPKADGWYLVQVGWMAAWWGFSFRRTGCLCGTRCCSWWIPPAFAFPRAMLFLVFFPSLPVSHNALGFLGPVLKVTDLGLAKGHHGACSSR